MVPGIAVCLPSQRHGKRQVLPGAQFGLEAIQVPQPGERLLIILPTAADIPAAPENLAALGLAETAQYPQQTGFTATVGARDMEDFSLR